MQTWTWDPSSQPEFIRKATVCTLLELHFSVVFQVGFTILLALHFAIKLEISEIKYQDCDVGCKQDKNLLKQIDCSLARQKRKKKARKRSVCLP